VNGFEVVSALKNGETAHVPILVLTAKQVTSADRVRLNGYVTAIVEKGQFDSASLTSEVRRAMSIRSVATGLEG
jgi:CheY-like chemotaxis protein